MKLQFELRPQNSRIGPFGTEGKMSNRGERLVRKLLALRSRLGRYHPEQHYMRGPGPETLRKLGEAYRDAAEGDTGARIPEEWIRLVGAIERRERNR